MVFRPRDFDRRHFQMSESLGLYVGDPGDSHCLVHNCILVSPWYHYCALHFVSNYTLPSTCLGPIGVPYDTCNTPVNVNPMDPPFPSYPQHTDRVCLIIH